MRSSAAQGTLKPRIPPNNPPPPAKKAEFQGGLSGGGLGQNRGGVGGGRGRTDMELHFDKLRTHDKLEEGADSVGPKGLAHLCAEINVPFNDLDFYILMFKIGATQSYCITRSEWVHAAHSLHIEHVGQLKSSLSQWRTAVLADKHAFAEFYYATFDFIRGDEDKWLPLDKALRAWAVLLPEGDRFRHLSLWAQWCSLEYKRPITRDVWRELLEFARKVEDLSAYDPSDKWPTAFDDFVEWALEKKGIKRS